MEEMENQENEGWRGEGLKVGNSYVMNNGVVQRREEVHSNRFACSYGVTSLT